jgi:hypothetical protein
MDPKTFYQQLPTAPVTPTLFQEAVNAANQIATLPKDQAQDLIPIVLADIKDDSDGSKHAGLGLYALSKRPDSGEILKPYLKNIAALFAHADPAFKATAGMVLVNMHPQPPEAADVLLGFISGPTGSINEKIDALSALTHLANPPKDKIDAVAIPLLKQPMAPSTMAAAVFACVYPGSSDALIDAIAQHLTDSDWQVRMRVIVVFRAWPAAIGRYRGQLTKIANDPAEPDAIRKFAQNTLDGKDEKCLILQGNPPQLIPDPSCR